MALTGKFAESIRVFRNLRYLSQLVGVLVATLTVLEIITAALNIHLIN